MKYTPPLDYNCRCFLTQEFEPPAGSTIVAPNDFKTKPAFERDYLKKKQIFTDNMPFMNQAKNEEMGLTPVKFSDEKLFKSMNKAMCEMLPKLQHGWEEYNIKSGGIIMRHVFSNENTYKREISQLSPFIRKGETAYMLPELKTHLGQTLSNFNNPDAILRGRIWELKKQEGTKVVRFFKNHFDDAIEKQMAHIVIMEVNDLDWKAINNQLIMRWKDDRPERVIIVHKSARYILRKIGGKIERLTE
ncbi:MAG: hypothetical protein M9892_01070 [Bacteroidetes bacterium]|nr:hypothetical protein [Bacteroidota bacterium]